MPPARKHKPTRIASIEPTESPAPSVPSTPIALTLPDYVRQRIANTPITPLPPPPPSMPLPARLTPSMPPRRSSVTMRPSLAELSDAELLRIYKLTAPGPSESESEEEEEGSEPDEPPPPAKKKTVKTTPKPPKPTSDNDFFLWTLGRSMGLTMVKQAAGIIVPLSLGLLARKFNLLAPPPPTTTGAAVASLII